eukprot:jgi/Hompol1/6054/HPOL_000266-RA
MTAMFAVFTGLTLVGSSSPDVAIRLSLQGVSGVHAIIEVSPDGCEHFIEDLDSTNGTNIGTASYPLTKFRLYQLTHNKIINFGPSRCLYEIKYPEGSAEFIQECLDGSPFAVFTGLTLVGSSSPDVAIRLSLQGVSGVHAIIEPAHKLAEYNSVSHEAGAIKPRAIAKPLDLELAGCPQNTTGSKNDGESDTDETQPGLDLVSSNIVGTGFADLDGSNASQSAVDGPFSPQLVDEVPSQVEDQSIQKPPLQQHAIDPIAVSQILGESLATTTNPATSIITDLTELPDTDILQNMQSPPTLSNSLGQLGQRVRDEVASSDSKDHTNDNVLSKNLGLADPFSNTSAEQSLSAAPLSPAVRVAKQSRSREAAPKRPVDDAAEPVSRARTRGTRKNSPKSNDREIIMEDDLEHEDVGMAAAETFTSIEPKPKRPARNSKASKKPLESADPGQTDADLPAVASEQSFVTATRRTQRDKV